MPLVLDIDLDFFVSPITHFKSGSKRIPEKECSVMELPDSLEYLNKHCGLPLTGQSKGSCFENHDELFDYAIKNFNDPIHLVHVDAHADIGGGLPRCWEYIFTKYLHLNQCDRRSPMRGDYGLNCGNFLLFMAASGLLSEITFVSPPGWSDDYQPMYMKDFNPKSEAIQLRRYSTDLMSQLAMNRKFHQIAHEVDVTIPLKRVTMLDYISEQKPDYVFITRSPGYTPKSADILYDAIKNLIAPTF